MSHPDPIELHDHVYVRASAHVAGCAECAAAAERLEAERRELRDALSAEAVEPPADFLRRRKPWPMLTAAAGLLAVLGWLLVSPSIPEVPAAQGADEEIRRLAAELQSPSALRRELALAGLRAYGAQAHSAVTAVDPKLAEEFKTPSAEDIAQAKVLETIKRDFSFENMPAPRLMDALAANIPLPVLVTDEARERFGQTRVTFKVKDLAMTSVLKLFLSQFRLDFYALDARLHIAPPRAFMTSMLPIRVGPSDPAAAAIRDLGADDFTVRAGAIEALRRLDFSAEAALWAALDRPDAEAAGRAAELLRALYTPKSRGPALPDPKNPDLSRRINADFADTPLVQVVDSLRELTQVNVHLSGISNTDRIRVSFRCENLPAYAAFRLMMDPHGLRSAPRDGVVLLSAAAGDPDGVDELGPFWAAPATARRLQRLLESGEAVPRELAGAAFGPLRHAARRLPEPAAGRARTQLLDLYKELDLRLADHPTERYLASLSAGALALLDRRIAVDVVNETLAGLLRRHGIGVRLDQPDARTFTFKVEGVSVRAILDALTRVSPDLDWRMDGELIVLDTPGNTRAAAER